MTKIKLCGLSRTEDIECANVLLPDYIGFMFYEKSRRYVTTERARELSAVLSKEIKRVGVFVDASPADITRIAEIGLIDLVQLHGAEDDETIRAVQKETGLHVIKAFRIETAEDVKKAEQSKADFILLDHGAGGTGETFDWSLITRISRPYFLAGGLRPDNVTEAIRICHPYAVDVSSGIETEDKKDAAKMQQFVEQVRGTEHE